LQKARKLSKSVFLEKISSEAFKNNYLLAIDQEGNDLVKSYNDLIINQTKSLAISVLEIANITPEDLPREKVKTGYQLWNEKIGSVKEDIVVANTENSLEVKAALLVLQAYDDKNHAIKMGEIKSEEEKVANKVKDSKKKPQGLLKKMGF
jgi:hypothetical protein